MNGEGLERRKQPIESAPIEILPVVEDTEERYGEDPPDTKEGELVRYQVLRYEAGKNIPFERFILRKKIDRFMYQFSLFQHDEQGEYHVEWHTVEYGYAITNLSPEQRTELFITVASFIESAMQYSEDRMQRIEADPAMHSYTAEDIDTCIDEILAYQEANPHLYTDKSRRTIYTREDLAQRVAAFRGAELFEIYHTLFGRYFHKTGHPNDKMHGRARSRLFQTMFNKYLKNWKVAPLPYKDAIHFYLVRNDTASVESN